MTNVTMFGGVSRTLHVVDAWTAHAASAAHAAPAAAAQRKRRTATATSVDGGTV